MLRDSLARQHQQGATLVELVMTIVIISVAIAGVVGAFSLMAGRSADPLNQTRAVALAQIYYDELMAVYYDKETPLGGGVVDTNRVTCSQLARDLDINNPYESQGFDADYKVVGCAGNDKAFEALHLHRKDVKQIEISITDPSGNNYIFSAYRGNF